MYSQDVLNSVADELMASRINPDMAFPASVRITDLGFRAKMLAKRLKSKLRFPLEHSEKNVITTENDRDVRGQYDPFPDEGSGGRRGSDASAAGRRGGSFIGPRGCVN